MPRDVSRRDVVKRLVAAGAVLARNLKIALAPGSRMLPPARRRIDVRLTADLRSLPVFFEGRPIEVQW
jgi:hypothetical protein